MAMTLALVAASIARTAASLAKQHEPAAFSQNICECASSDALSGDIMRQMQDMHGLGLGGEGFGGEGLGGGGSKTM